MREILVEITKEPLLVVLNNLKDLGLLTGPLIGSAAYALLSGEFRTNVGDIDIFGSIPKKGKYPPFIEQGYITWFYKYPGDNGTLPFEYVKDNVKFNDKPFSISKKPLRIKGIEVIHPLDWLKYELMNQKSANDMERQARIMKIRKRYSLTGSTISTG